MKFLFVGEKPSRTATERSLTWQDGKLAAKTLFDALAAMGIQPHECQFYNVFGDHCDDAEQAPEARLQSIVSSSLPVVAMGEKVSRALQRAAIPHRKIIHPAARGRIRKKELYIAHVKEMLS